ncbi:porin [Bradyrhizobium elkanii]|uniref:porin n=1 Tax=Bradyrhizobium elkanii TaxID=29448 RepID=UPI002168B443|nr:porin [Bradyrhizobium elkanii]MCS3474175.1 putative porin [Bradyrhizobium elkanii]
MRAILSTAAILGVTTAACASELPKSSLEKLPASQKVIADGLEGPKKQHGKSGAQVRKSPTVNKERRSANAAPVTKGPKAALDDSLTWHGLTLYGQVDAGLTYLSHGAPLSPTAGTGVNYLIARNSNRSYFGLGANGFAGSFIGLKGKQDVADDVAAIFKLETAFNPQSGLLSDGPGSIVQNNGVPIDRQNSFADSSKAGQAFNVAAYAGLSSPTYGTLTYGRQAALTSEAVVAYDPMASASAFSVIGFQGATGGGGDTENRILDNSLKYAASFGNVRGAVQAQVGSGPNAGPRNAVQAQLGGGYLGLSVDAIFSQINGAISASPLPFPLPNGLPTNIGNGLVAGTISDNTSYMLVAKYAIGSFKFFGGYEHIQFANPKTPLSPGDTIAGGYVLGTVANNSFTTDRVLQIFWTGATYEARPDLDLKFAYYHEEQNSYHGAPGSSFNAGRCSNASLAQCSGQLDALSFLMDYKYSKHLDMYAGIMWSQVSNGLASGFLQRSTIDPTVGLRYRF